MTEKLLITIDGPAGAGKTTVSRILADRLEYRYVDTGALYRGVAYAAHAGRVDPADEDALAALFQSIQLSFRRSAGENRLFLDGEDISDRIRTPEITMMASAISAHKIVRENLLALQRNLGKNKAAVFEGRDMGTVVFPDADLKFYLDASLAKTSWSMYEESFKRFARAKSSPARSFRSTRTCAGGYRLQVRRPDPIQEFRDEEGEIKPPSRRFGRSDGRVVGRRG
jgi:cytidylate kinase